MYMSTKWIAVLHLGMVNDPLLVGLLPGVLSGAAVLLPDGGLIYRPIATLFGRGR